MTARAFQRALTERSTLVGDNRRLRAVEGRRDRPGQIVVKVCGLGKTRGDVKRMMDYVARLRKQDRDNGIYGSARVFDEAGQPLSPEQVKAQADRWDIIADQDNLSPAAKRAGDDAVLLPVRDRYWRNQALHLAISVSGEKEGHSEEVMEALEQVAGAVIYDLFADDGHRILWGMHLEHPNEDPTGAASGGTKTVNPHIHMVIEMKGRGGPKAKRIILDRRGDLFDAIRTSASIAARDFGLNVVAERREDRWEVRDAVLRGEERLRPSHRMSQVKGPSKRLIDRCPGWFNQHGLDYERRRRERQERRGKAIEVVLRSGKIDPNGRPTPRDVEAAYREMLPDQPSLLSRPGVIGRLRQRQIPEGLRDLFSEINDAFRDPVKALVGYQEMATDGAYRDARGKVYMPNKSLADWYMRKQPLAFGDLTALGADPSYMGRLDLSLALRRALPPYVEQSDRQIDIGKLDKLRGEFLATERLSGIERDQAMIVHSLTRLAENTRDRLDHESRAQRILAVASKVAGRPVMLSSKEPSNRGPGQGLGRGSNRGEGRE